jgi:hypothetical protein
MQDRPAKEVLLDALSGFLLQQVRPAISDAGLNFRVLIAANLAMVVANEIRGEEAQNTAELSRLRDLLPDVRAETTESPEAMRRAIEQLNKALAERLRKGDFDPAALGRATAHVKQTLLEKLAVNNPRFDTALEIEGGS